MFRAGSLAFRGVLAIALMLGFYGLASAVAWALFYIPYAEIVYLHRLDFRLAFFCITGAGIVVWSVIPRRDRFEAPGPELHASKHPELFRILDSVRQATRQKPPRNVYLIPDVNAWVAQRGGFMGFGSRRVMGLGLPLLQVLTVDQLRAVVAHEFGHYYAGDTMLGPWIQKTRMGILRTIGSLGESWIRFPFTLYATMFFRTTNAVSRQQEFAADALSARIAGPLALVEGLKQIHRAAAAFGIFWQSEYVPALRYQVRPPLGAGFSSFLHHRQIASSLETMLHEEMAAAKTDPYDSHPPLAERCAALAGYQPVPGPGDSRPSIGLVNGLPELEQDLLRIAVHPDLKDARPVGWSEIPLLVWYPNWSDEVRRQAAALHGAAVSDAAALCREPQGIARQILFPPGILPDMEQRCAEARRVVGIALGVALVGMGWRMEGDPGDPITCTRDGETLMPLVLVKQFESGEVTPEAWCEQCKRLGISALRLAPAGAAAVATAG